MAGRQILEAAPESTQQPVWDAELKKEQEHDQFVESGKYSGIGLTVVGIHEAGEGISHLHAAYLTGNLSGLEDELEGQSEKEPNGEFAGQNHEERGRGNRGRRRGNQRRHERGEQKSESNFDARGDSGAAEEGRNHQQAGDARPGDHPGSDGALEGQGKRHRYGHLEHNYLNRDKLQIPRCARDDNFLLRHRFIGQKGESRTTGRW